jgi:endonuclease YncB( thermonuclease family)
MLADGDTITALDTGNKQRKVRLSLIDAREKGQPFGRTSRESFSSTIARLVRARLVPRSAFRRPPPRGRERQIELPIAVFASLPHTVPHFF